MSSLQARFQTSSLFQLTLARFRLFLREPEAIFWTFLFPILLALGLGIAFRNRPADVLPVAATTPQLTQALAADKGLNAKTVDAAEGAHELAIGTIQCSRYRLRRGVTYRYDDTNPDARAARLLADRAVQAAAGRHDAIAAQNDLVHETGSRYIDFVIPGLLGMNLMGSAIWSLGFSIVEARQKKLLKRMVASPMPRWQYLAAFSALAAALACDRSGRVPRLRSACLRSAVSRLAVAACRAVRAYLARPFVARPADCLAGKDDGKQPPA